MQFGVSKRRRKTKIKDICSDLIGFAIQASQELDSCKRVRAKKEIAHCESSYAKFVFKQLQRYNDL